MGKDEAQRRREIQHRHDGFEIVAVGAEAVQPDDRSRGVFRVDLDGFQPHAHFSQRSALQRISMAVLNAGRAVILPM